MRVKRDAPTMKDVAREAGVSIGTVSNVLNGLPVSETYRLRVNEAAAKLNYRPASQAKPLKSGRTNCVALLVPSIRHPFFAALTDEITDCLMHYGCRNNLIITNSDPNAEKKALDLVVNHKLDGIIGLTYNPDLEIAESIPFVTIDRHFSPLIPCVASDNFRGGQLAADRLITLGCRSLLFLRIGSDIYGEVNKRESGFETVCRSRNIPYDSLSLHEDASVSRIMEYLLTHIHDGIPDFDGIFCNSDMLAVQVKEFLESLHISVPDMVQIIGYDGVKNYYTGRMVCSTIVQPVRKMAEAAVDIILNYGHSTYPALVNIPVHYEPGGTTKDSV